MHMPLARRIVPLPRFDHMGNHSPIGRIRHAKVAILKITPQPPRLKRTTLPLTMTEALFLFHEVPPGYD